MTVDRWLALLGVILAVPSFVLSFFQKESAVFVQVGLFGSAGVLGAILWSRLNNLPPFGLHEARVRLKFKDAGGHEAVLSKAYQYRPNHPHLDYWEHRNIAADGTVQNLKWEGAPGVGLDVKEFMGEYIARVKFAAPLKKWKTYSGTLSYSVMDSFPGALEGIEYVVDFAVKKAVIAVEFADGQRPRKRSWVTIRRGGTIEDLGPPKELGNVLEFETKYPTLGAAYTVNWEW